MSDIPAYPLAEIRDALTDIVDRLDLLLPPEPGAEPKVRLTVDVPEGLHTRIKATCQRNKLKMNVLILEGVHRAARTLRAEGSTMGSTDLREAAFGWRVRELALR
jgi:hypothetical protein